MNTACYERANEPHKYTHYQERTIPKTVVCVSTIYLSCFHLMLPHHAKGYHIPLKRCHRHMADGESVSAF